MSLTKVTYSMIDGAYINVKDFGAVGNGTTDDSAAVQAAFDAATAQQINTAYAGSSVNVNASPILYFPLGVYRINTKIDVGVTRSVSIYGEGKVLFLGNPSLSSGVDFLYGTSLRYLNVENVQFQNFDTCFDVSTNNLDLSKWQFENVQCAGTNLFIDSGSYDTSRSTIVSFDNCIWQYDTVQIAKIYCDNVTFRNCWIGSSTTSPDSIYANSNLSFYGCMFIPAGSGAVGRAAVRLTNDDGASGVANDVHRGVVFSGCRMSNEGGQGPILICDYPLVNDNVSVTPAIHFSGCALTGFTPTAYQTGNSESGIVYLLQYPASIKFDSCSFFTLGSGNGKLVAKSDSLVAAAPDSFTISTDQATYYNAQRAVGEVDTYTIATSMAQFINNPAPYIFRDIVENGNLICIDTASAGVKKATFTLNSGWTDATYPAPIVFLLSLGGQGTAAGAGPNDQSYSGASLYAVTMSFFFNVSHQARLAYTKIHGDDYGNLDNANCDIVSLHFGSGDTGAATAARATSYTVTVAFGAGVNEGSARVMPGFEKISRYGQNPQ
jgi:Pectate lyase superfamily protein